ncbi:uncharacterized protein LOC129611791 [Condylostylus longicornis]|uniref:uncharacterized protein LOC129611791 n=1 Tax=Condylostylus longicornis TaxID=2530218 RepID=UPI00244DCE79|nr:uncharacterized protein LOC129611791 [Condylostylus longicornis]
MVYSDLELIEKLKIKFPQFGSSHPIDINSDISFGEIIHDGKLSWLATGAHLEIFSLKDGQRISSYHFDCHSKFEKAIITSITEIECANDNCCFLAVGLQISDSVRSIIAIYSVQGSKILRCIEISDRITCCVHISEDITKRNFLQLMEGCLAVGTDIGKLILLDINFKKCEAALLEEGDDKLDTVPCHMVKSTLDFTHISNHYKHTLQENFNFGIELEHVKGESFVLSLLPVPPALCLVAGLEDGRMIIYDLTELQILYIVLPQEHLSPLSKMAFLQPQDDPKAMIYIWAFHENPKSCFAVMHCLEYEKKIVDDNEQIILFEEFQTSHVKLVLTMNEKESLPIRCQAITKFSNREDDGDSISICMLAWKTKNFIQLLIFDMNQWYKEEMPEGGDWREHLTYLSPFRVKNLLTYDVYFDKNTVSHFNSVQRTEEHFYPISLTFDFVFLLSNASVFFHWPGLQYKALDYLNAAGPLAILDPGPYYTEIKCAYLMPQFFDLEKRKKREISLSTQREILLSVALEYNCIGLLKNCARSWADGSCIGQKPNEGLSLSTLTDWIWKRAGALKQRCNNICVCLFDYSGRLMDQRSKKELFHLTRQLKILASLLEIILTNCKQHIPGHVYERLDSELNSIRIASEYHDVLQWLLNIGLLPEGLPESSTESNSTLSPLLVPYPYKLLNNYYKTRRLHFLEINHDFIQARTNGCRILYIDSFIEHKCNVEALKEHWQIELGQAAYPPRSMQAVLRTLLVPNVSLETKHALLIYIFLDLNMAVTEESYAGLVQNLIKFPAVFKLNASLIKTVQAFWNLDHGKFEVALEEILCPFLHERKLEQWEQELLIESLLIQKRPSSALRALQAKSAPVNSILELKVYMANNLVSEAFHLTRSKNDPELLKTFVKCCEYLGKWNILRDLALTEEEEKIVEDLLKDFKKSKPENIYLMHMLQKSKYIEAKTFLEEMKFGNNIRQNSTVNNESDFELSKTLLSAYNCTMTPFSKNLNECYYNIRSKIGFSNKLKNINSEKCLKPFSAELLKENKKGLTDELFQSSILSIDGASNYWNEKSASKNREERMMQTNNVPFVRKPQLEAYIENFSNADLLAYPETFKEPKKRRLSSDNSFTSNGIPLESPIQENRKKRIRLTELDNIGVFNENDKKKFVREKSNKNELERSTDSPDLLKTPIVESCKFVAKERSEFDKNKSFTPHSILKTKGLSKPTSQSILRPVKISNAKRIQHEYFESESASEVTESENDIHGYLSHPDNVEDVSDAFATCKDFLSESPNLDANEVDSVIYQNNNISDLEKATEAERDEKTTLNCSTALRSPMRRRAIKTSQISVVPTTGNEYLTSTSSVGISRLFPLKDNDTNSNIRDVSIHKEISKDSGAIVDQFELSNVNPNKSISSIARRPIRRSETPPKRNENIKISSKRIVHSEEMSDSDMLARRKPPEISQKTVEFRSYTISATPSRPPISRLVTENNFLKNISFTKDQKHSNGKEKTSTENFNFKEITEYNSNLYKANTNEFNPLTCSSKVTHTVSKFIENSKQVKLSDQTTVWGDISVSDVIINKSNCENDFPPSNQKEEAENGKSLMTTIDATSFSWAHTAENSNKLAENFEYDNKRFTQNIMTQQNNDQNKNSTGGIKVFEVMESDDEESAVKVTNATKNENKIENTRNQNNDSFMKIDENYRESDKNNESVGEESDPESGMKEKEHSEELEQKEAKNLKGAKANVLLPKYERPSYHHLSEFVNNSQSKYVDVIDISSESGNSSDSSSNDSESSPSNSLENSQATSKESSISSVENEAGTPNAEHISYDLMEKILRNATSRNLKKALERKQMNEIPDEQTSDRPISVSSSLDSTLEISNEDVDISKDHQIDENVNIHMNEKNGTSIKKEEIISQVENKNEKVEKSANSDLNDVQKSSEDVSLVQKAGEKENVNEASSNEQEKKDSCENSEHDEILKKSASRNIRAHSEQPINILKTSFPLSTQKNISIEISGKRNERANSTEPVLTGKNSHWLRSSTQPNPSHIPEDNTEIVVDKTKAVSPEVISNKVRAKSTERELFHSGLTHSPRPKRAVSEQPDESTSKFRKIKKTTSPNTIITRRKSRLLDRIEEEPNLESSKTKPVARKRNDSSEYKSESSFKLHVDSELSPPTTPAKKLKNSEELDGKILSHKKSRKVSRGASLEKDITAMEEEGKTHTPTRFSRRLSLYKDTDTTGNNEESPDSLIKTKRRNSMFVENPDVISSPRTRRASSSLREMVLTPRRSTRSVSLSKELSPSIKSENSEKNEENTPVKRTSRRLSHNENTLSKSLYDEESENISGFINNQSDYMEADTSVNKSINETETYSMQRRLTRTQKNLLEKSANIKAIDQRTIPLKKRQSRMDLDETIEIESPSKSDDAISVRSSRSKKSTTSVRHSSRLSAKAKDDVFAEDEDDNEDRESTVSSLKSTTSNRTPRKKKIDKSKLNVISEKDEENQKNLSDVESNSTINSSGPKLRTRTKKTN